MFKLIKHYSRKAGLPPGTLVHVGEKKIENVRIEKWEFNEKEIREQIIDSIASLALTQEPGTVTWIQVKGIHQVEVIEEIGRTFNLGSLEMEDIVNTIQPPKIDELDEYIFLVLRSFDYDGVGESLNGEQISLFFKNNLLITFEESENGILRIIKDRLRKGRERVRKKGSDYMVYSIIDSIVDNYFVVLENLIDKIEVLEEKLINDPDVTNIAVINQHKKNILLLRRSVWPLREILNSIMKYDEPLLAPDSLPFYKDLYGHVAHAIDIIAMVYEMISDLHGIYLSSVSNRMNQVMKVLTIIATIFIPLTFLAGVYGMNFKFMPELGWRYSYYIVWGIMVLVFIGLLVFFRRKKWL